MAPILDIMDTSNPIFQSYIFWSTILVLKMLAMAPMTGMNRFKNKSFANKEDMSFAKDKDPKTRLDDPEVERVRRAHLNDLENIPAFIIVAFFFVLTKPNEFIAINLFRIAAIGRIFHTVAYVVLQKQPHRAIGWAVCYAATIFMALRVLMAF